MSSNISLQTGQNVHLDYQLVSVGDRILATLIDVLVIIGYVLMWVIVFQSTGKPGTAIMILLGLPIMFYSISMEIFFNGQSIGKRTMNTQVLKLDGSTPSISDYLLRWMFRLVDVDIFMVGIAILTIIIN